MTHFAFSTFNADYTFVILLRCSFWPVHTAFNDLGIPTLHATMNAKIRSIQLEEVLRCTVSTEKGLCHNTLDMDFLTHVQTCAVHERITTNTRQLSVDLMDLRQQVLFGLHITAASRHVQT